MTVEEKDEVIARFCEEQSGCDTCVLEDHPRCNKWCEDVTDEDINSAYDLVKTEDNVNHPSHYTTGMECIDEMILVFGETTVADFCLCNVWKYRKRALHKNGEEDLKKADWYMNKYKELIEKRHIGVEEYVREH